MSTRRFSICVPTFERSQAFLEQSLASVLAQELGDFELLVSDNASSTDTARRVCDALGDPRLRYWRHGSNLGMAGNWSSLAAAASGSWINILHDDDEMLPGALTRVAEFVDDHPEVGLVASIPERMDAVGRSLGTPPFFVPPTAGQGVVAGPEFAVLSTRSLTNYLCAPGVFVSRPLMQRRLPFSSWPKLTTDLNMWLRILTAGTPMVVLDTPGVRYRVHPGQDTWRRYRYHRFYIALELWRVRHAFAPPVRRLIRKQLVRAAARGVRHRDRRRPPAE